MCRIMLYDNKEPGEISLEAVRQITDVQLPEDIIAIADIQFPNERCDGYNLLDNKLSSVFFFEDGNCCYFLIGDDLVAEVQDESRTYVRFRMWKPNTDDFVRRRFCETVLAGQVTNRHIEQLTTGLASHIREIYKI